MLQLVYSCLLNYRDLLKRLVIIWASRESPKAKSYPFSTKSGIRIRFSSQKALLKGHSWPFFLCSESVNKLQLSFKQEMKSSKKCSQDKEEISLSLSRYFSLHLLYGDLWESIKHWAIFYHLWSPNRSSIKGRLPPPRRTRFFYLFSCFHFLLLML